jgi:hypothetical protein
MDRQTAGIGIARRVSVAISDAGSDVHSVAQAADITPTELDDRLSGRVDFQLRELRAVGGFLRIPVTRFMEVTA